jgi:hypothetical protein
MVERNMHAMYDTVSKLLGLCQFRGHLLGDSWNIERQCLCQNLKTLPVILAKDSCDKLFVTASGSGYHFLVVAPVAVPIVITMLAAETGHD